MWLDDDQDADLAYSAWLIEDAARRCPHCGTVEEDWVDPTNGRPLRDPAYVVKVVQCQGCVALAEDVDDTDEPGVHRFLVSSDLDARVHPADTDA